MKKNFSHFKYSTRAILSESEKEEILESVDRSVRYLDQCLSDIKAMSVGESWSGRLLRFRISTQYLNRLVTLVKGYSQPKHLYCGSRLRAIEYEAERIAQATGADVNVVRRVFVSRMQGFIRE